MIKCDERYLSFELVLEWCKGNGIELTEELEAKLYDMVKFHKPTNTQINKIGRWIYKNANITKPLIIDNEYDLIYGLFSCIRLVDWCKDY